MLRRGINWRIYYAALLPRRGPHIASHSVCLSVRPSVPLLLPSVTWRHLANYNDTFRHAQRAAYRTAISAAQTCYYYYYNSDSIRRRSITIGHNTTAVRLSFNVEWPSNRSRVVVVTKTLRRDHKSAGIKHKTETTRSFSSCVEVYTSQWSLADKLYANAR